MRTPYRIISWTTPVLLLAVWQALARSGVISPQILPAPLTVLATARNLTETGELPRHLLISLQRAVIGFAIGASLGLALGIAVGLSRLAEAVLDRTVQIMRAIPFLAIIPLVIVWFGVGETGKMFLVALGTLFPLYLNTVLGIRQVDPKLLEMGRVTGLGRLALIRAVVLPGALPSILNGVRLALTNAWLALVVAETVGAAAGIGFMATNAREFLQTDVIVLVIVLYALIGIVADLIARLLERRLLSWHPNYAKPGK
jgi:sulfonate transport system permease protein